MVAADESAGGEVAAMRCDECGERIVVGSEYLHNEEKDTNYHFDCEPIDGTRYKLRYLED